MFTVWFKFVKRSQSSSFGLRFTKSTIISSESTQRVFREHSERDMINWRKLRCRKKENRKKEIKKY